MSYRHPIIAGLLAFTLVGQSWAQDDEATDLEGTGDAADVDAYETDMADAGEGEVDPDAEGSLDVSLQSGFSEEGSVSAGGQSLPYAPRANTWEIGLFTGMLFMSRAHNLQDEGTFRRAYQLPSWVLGARLAYFPTRAFGIEAETYHGHGDIKNISSPTKFIAYRAHAIFQYPDSRVVPFGLIGLGALSATSASDIAAVASGERTAATSGMGFDSDLTVHLGIGAKYALNDYLSLRLDLRENIMQEGDHLFADGTSFSEELLLGMSVVFPRQRTVAAAAARADSDGDRVPDDEDACPDVKAFTADGCPPDTDGDGILDDVDECPYEAGPEPTGCPDKDPDGDGVLVPCDLCPDEAGPAPTGCPVGDRDGDGILDDKDRCPDDPETANGFEDEDGCPDEVPTEVQAFTGVIKGIVFDRGKATIRPTSRTTLDKAVTVLKKFPSIRLEISGHTSSEGDAAFNDELSKERAESVRSYLVDAGVEDSRLTAVGRGSSQPRVEEKNEATREQNRRIEFKIQSQ